MRISPPPPPCYFSTTQELGSSSSSFFLVSLQSVVVDNKKCAELSTFFKESAIELVWFSGSNTISAPARDDQEATGATW